MIPLLAIALVSLVLIVLRWVVCLVLKFLRPSPIKKDYTYAPTVSVLIPVFNEGPAVFNTIESIAQSDYPNLDIIAIDDASSDKGVTWDFMEKAAAKYSNVRIGRNAVNSKKPQTIINALRMSTSEIVVYIDSDCVVRPNTIRELVAVLADPEIGACGGTIGVQNVNETIITKFTVLEYYLSFVLFKLYENQIGTVTCVSGGLFGTRRELLERAVPYIQSRNFFGVKVVTGEDRALTSLIRYEFGLKTVCNLDAHCLTTVPATFMSYIKQRKRWRAGTLLDFFTTLFRTPKSVHKIGLAPTLCMLIPGGSALLYSLVCIIAPLFDPLFFREIAPFAWFIGISTLLLFIIKKFAPEQRLVNPFGLVVFGVWWVISNVFITALAVTSLDSSDWGTR